MVLCPKKVEYMSLETKGVEVEGGPSCHCFIDPLGEFVFLVPAILGFTGLEVLVLRRTCFHQETQEESL